MRAQRTTEAAFTLVEMMVVIILILIISSIGFMGIRGARSSGAKLEASAAARRYADAIQRYQQEHGRQVPVMAAGSTSWPLASANKGPIYTLKIGASVAKTHPYLKGGRAPDIMTKGAAAGAKLVPANGACPTPAAKGGTLLYRTGPVGANACGPALAETEFTIRVYWDGAFLCDAGDASKNRC
jgi:prepilin-type N-terminal cleavage/methylation domain-containing protein